MSDQITSRDDVERRATEQSHLEEKSSNGDVESQVKGPGAGAGPQDYSHGFWDPELASMRKEYLLGIAKVTFLICVLIWGIVTIYWGSLWKSNDLSYKLNAYVVNRDTGAIGTNITNAFLNHNNARSHLTWSSIPAFRYPTAVSIDTAIGTNQDAWILVEIIQDATVLLDTARTNADASWNPSNVVRVYYAEARNQQAVNGAVLGDARGVLTASLALINPASTAQWLQANTANAAALTAVANQAPQTIATPVAVSYFNVRPWSAAVSIAPTFVGLIYALILAFNITMANFGMRQGIQRKLRFPSLVLMRILVPLAAYVILSCMFSMINIPFKLPFGGMGLTSDPYGAGFMIWWMFTFLGMALLGLATETFVSLVGPQFIGFALVVFIIINVSVANLPIELQFGFYQYGYAMPFYNLRQAYITIIYNTGKQIYLLKYMGILLAWLAIVFITFPIWIWNERRISKKMGPGAAAPGGH